MKNRELLKTGKKPAPGELILLQGLINTADLEDGSDDLATPSELKAWLVRHGLLAASTAITPEDFQDIISFRELVRQVLASHHAGSAEANVPTRLNRLMGDASLAVRFGRNGQAVLQPRGKGMQMVMGRLLAIIVQASLDGHWSRLKICQSSTCRWAFYDASKNNSGRWCSMAVCGSRTKARQYRRRHAATSP